MAFVVSPARKNESVPPAHSFSVDVHGPAIHQGNCRLNPRPLPVLPRPNVVPNALELWCKVVIREPARVKAGMGPIYPRRSPCLHSSRTTEFKSIFTISWTVSGG